MCGMKIQFFGPCQKRVNFWLLLPASLLIEACGKLYIQALTTERYSMDSSFQKAYGSE